MQHPRSEFDGRPDGVDAHRRPIDGDFDHDGPNNHLALIYESQEEQFATAIPFVRAGLERGERCLYIADDNATTEVVDAMEAAGIDVAAAREAGLLSIHSKDDIYLKDGSFDPADTITFLEETVTEAVETQGFEHVRITGEMTWVLDDERGTDRDTLAEYEANINHYYPGEAVTGLCQYNRNRFSPAVLRDVVRTHPQIVYEETFCQNFFYVPPGQFFEDETSSAAFDRTLEKVLHQTELRETLRERNADVAALTESARDLLEADPSRITTQALENARQVLDTERVAICLYDETDDALASCTTGDDDFDPDCRDDGMWEAFVTNETRVLDGEGDAAPTDADEDLVVVPLGRHGVFVVAAAEDIGATDRRFAETIAANVRTAFDRADREGMLENRTATVRDQRDRLEGLRTANELLRTVVTTLVEASSRPEIDRTVCERLTDVGPWQFAWVGETNATSEQVAGRATAGDAVSYLDDVAVPVADDPTVEPAGRAAATGSLQVVDDVGDVPDEADWRREALERGFESVASVPLQYEGISYGVLSIYGDEPAAFDDRTRDVLADVGMGIGFACNAVDRREALVSDRASELDLRIPDGDSFVNFVTLTGATVDVDGAVPVPESAAEGENRRRVFFTVEGTTHEGVDRAAAEAAPFSSLSLVSEREEELSYDGVVDGEGVLGTLLDHAAVPKSVASDGDAGRVVVRLPPSTDVASFVQMLQERYPGTELVARREVEYDPATRDGFRSDLRDRLTDRQWDALQTAYLSGYFEWPRDRSGEEVGERLDVSQPTFNRHLRDSLRKLLAPIFEDGEDLDR